MVASNDLNISQSGIVVFNGISTFTGRTITAGTGITITNGSGVSGNPIISASGTVGQTFTGNSGVATPSSGNINIVTSNSTVKFVGSGSTLTQDFGIANLVLGSSLPSLTSGTRNVGVGSGVLGTITSGNDNVSMGSLSAQAITIGLSNTLIGARSGLVITTGSSNVFVGYGSGADTLVTNGNVGIGALALNSLIGTGSTVNVAVGNNALVNLLSGTVNIAVGSNSGNAYTTTESSNIIIGHTGVVGESNKIRIGTSGSGSGQQNQAFIAGITGVTAAGSPVAVSSTGQLSDLGFGTSTQVLTSNGAGVSPTWQSAGFAGSPTYFQAYLTSNQTVAGGSTTDTIVFDTATSNVGIAYNVATGVFTAPATGYYGFACTVFFNNLATPVGLSQIILAYTGSAQSLRLQNLGLVPATTGAAYIATSAWAMPMTLGDTVQLQPYADGAGDYVIAGSAVSATAFNTGSTFSGWRIA